MPSESMRPAPEQAGFVLLFRQTLLLGAMAGILWHRHPLEGSLLLVGIAWASLFLPGLASSGLNPSGATVPEFTLSRFSSSGQGSVPVCALLLVAAFFCGAAHAHLRAPGTPAEPEWLRTLPGLAQKAEHSFLRPPALTVEGRIAELLPLPGNRLRLLLEDIRPLSPSREQGRLPPSDLSPYAGPVLLSWYDPPEGILAGQTFSGSLRLSPVRSLANPGTHDSAEFHADREIFYRAWTMPDSPSAGKVSGPGSWLARQREGIRRCFYAALPLSTSAPEKEAASYGFPSGRNESNPPIYGTGAAMLPALIMGDRSFLSPEQSDRIARATLAHSLSLSGLHLGYALALGYGAAWLFGSLFPGLYTRVPRPFLGMALAFPLALAYTWLGQAPVSLLRSLCMFLFFALLLFAKRPKVMMDGLLAAVFFLLLLNPNALFDISLQLSALSVAVIALALPDLQRIVRWLLPLEHSRRGGRTLQETLGRTAKNLLRHSLLVLLLSLCIQAVLTPLTLRAFGTIGLWFPLNLLWLPVLGFLVMPAAFGGLLASLTGFDSLARLCLNAAALPCEWLMRLLGGMDDAGLLLAPVTLRPHSLTIAGYWILCLTLPALWKTLRAHRPRTPAVPAEPPQSLPRSRGLPPAPVLAPVILGICLVVAPLLHALHAERTRPVGLHVLDTGQGQAVLITWPGGRALVDGGGLSPLFNTGQRIVGPALTDNERARVAMLINTHPDFDHLDGLVHLLKHFSVNALYHNGDLPYGPLAARLGKAIEGREWLEPVCRKAGDTIPLEGSGAVLEVLWPPDCPDQGEGRADRRDPAHRGLPEEDSPHGRTVAETLAERGTAAGAGQEKTNDHSLVLRLVWQGRPLALLCGDAGQKTLRQLVRKAPDRLRAEILVLPHHGSATGMVPALYDAVQPRVAVASCGYQNRWNFPVEKVRRALQDRDIPLYSTAVSGQIRILWPDALAPFTAFGARALEQIRATP